MRSAKFAELIGCAAIVALLALLALRFFLVLATPHERLSDVVEFIYDDGYYYLAVAANLAETGMSTFDGLSLTNGYQPLWLLLLAGLAKLVGTGAAAGTHAFFVAACGLIYAVALAAPLLTAWFMRSSPQRPLALALCFGLCVVMVAQPQVFLQGLEPILFAPIVLPLILIVERGPQGRDWFKLSGLLALAFLVRLDALTIFCATIAVLAVADASGAQRSVAGIAERSVRIALRLAVVVVPVAAVYFIVNQVVFGSAVPVSGLAKLIGGPKFSNWGVALMYFDHWRSVALVAVIMLGLEAVARRNGKPGSIFYRSMAIVSIAMVVQCAYYCALSTWNTWPWYSYPVALLTAIILARIVYLAALIIEDAGLRFVGWGAAALVLMWAGNHGRHFLMDSLPARQVAKLTFNQASLKMLADFFPPGDGHHLIAMGDRAGGLAYWGRDRLSVVQLEGLTLDKGYIDARNLKQANDYLETRFPIEYLVVDREHYAEVSGPGGNRQWVVPEPIQGRVTVGEVPVFCFADAALKYKFSYPAIWGEYTRIAFRFGEREQCLPEATAMMRSVERGIGLRQFSLPSEYRADLGGTMDKRREDADRENARREYPF